jgi:hypothetical protein
MNLVGKPQGKRPLVNGKEGKAIPVTGRGGT